MKKEMGLRSKERQLARLHERLDQEGAIAIACLWQKKQQVLCRRYVDRIVAP